MDLLEKAHQLHNQGFAVIPTDKKKAPLDTNWPTFYGDNRVVPNGNFQQDAVAGVGVILGQWHTGDTASGFLACIDVDCENKDISRRLCDYIMEKLGGTYPYRVGQPPRFAVPVLLNDQWHKVKSNKYDDKHHLELLACGQQFVAYGAHPKGQKGQYQWYNGDLTGDLPLLAEGDLWDIINTFNRLCEEAGYDMTAAGTRERAALDTGPADDLEVAIANQPLDMDAREVKALLARYPAQGLDYDNWLLVGAALNHQYGGSEDGLKRWLKWSSKSDKHDAREMPKKYASFGKRARPVTLATIIKLAKERGQKEFVETKGSFLQPGSGDYLGQGTYISWLIEGIVEAGTIGQIFSPPGVAKTFLALDMAAHLAAGTEWNGRRVVSGPVVFLAGEGVAGISRRLAALELEKGLDTSNIILSKMPNFDHVDELRALMKEIDALPIPPVMIVVDTLARAAQGVDENSSKEMGPIMERMATFARRYGCAVMAIHHTPKAKAGSAEGRGSGAIKGAMDFEIRLEKASDEAVMMTCAKSKDAEPFKAMAFGLVSVELPANHTDNFGNRITSAVIEWLNVDEVARQLEPSPTGKELMRAFDMLWADETNRLFTPPAIVAQYGLDAPAQGLDWDQVADYWQRSQDRVDASWRMAKRRGLEDVQAKGLVRLFDSILVKI